MPASSASSPSRSAESGVSSAGLRTTVLPQASAGPSFQRRDVEREVPGDDQPDDAERLAEGQVDAAGDGDRLAVPLVDGAGVEVEDVARPCRPRRGRRRSACRRSATRSARALRGAPRRASRAAAAAAPRSAGGDRPPSGKRRLERARRQRRSPRPRPVRGSAIASSVAGLRTVTVTARFNHGADSSRRNLGLTKGRARGDESS